MASLPVASTPHYISSTWQSDERPALTTSHIIFLSFLIMSKRLHLVFLIVLLFLVNMYVCQEDDDEDEDEDDDDKPSKDGKPKMKLSGPITIKGVGNIDLIKKCSACSDFVKEFHRRMDKTEKKTFGIPDKKLEESKHGKYKFSETRLIEIVEGICPDDTCNRVMEHLEAPLEHWWFSIYAKGHKKDLFEHLCIEHGRYCCWNGTYGEDCDDCPGGRRKWCSGHGYCNGEGTRFGDGKCSCDKGYDGTLCSKCATKFYRLEGQ